MIQRVAVAYVDGKFIKILRLATNFELPDWRINCFAPASSSKGRHAEFRSNKTNRNRR